MNYPQALTQLKISEVVDTMRDDEVTLKTEYDEISLKTKRSLTRFGGNLER